MNQDLPFSSEEIETIRRKIQQWIGMILNDSHLKTVLSYINSFIKKENISFEQYIDKVPSNKDYFKSLVNVCTINETYFFREELQFDFLKDKFLPSVKNRELNLWSAACSCGQEIYSLYALCRKSRIKAEFYASDIDETSMEILKAGKYNVNSSIRDDGKKYAAFLENIGTFSNECFTVYPEVRERIHCFYCNFTNEKPFTFPPDFFDIVLIRNVFIYFSQELKARILNEIASVLKPEGIILVSVSEIASIVLPKDSCLTKECSGNIYYLRKISCSKRNSRLQKESQTFRQKIPSSLQNPQEEKAEQKAELSAQKQTEKNAIPSLLQDFTEQILQEINSNNLENAKLKLGKYAFPANFMEIKYFLYGIISSMEKSTEDAKQYFLKASILNQEFWPAFFQLGLIYTNEKNRKEGIKVLKRCIELLENYEKEQKVCYNFFVESFSPVYFKDTCKTLLNTLEQ